MTKRGAIGEGIAPDGDLSGLVWVGVVLEGGASDTAWRVHGDSVENRVDRRYDVPLVKYWGPFTIDISIKLVDRTRRQR